MRARITLLVTALTLAAGGAGASVAGASPPVTPTGSVGACNMTNPNAQFGMFTIAQFAPNPISQGFSHGWNGGMMTAINNTNPNDLGFCG